MKEPSKDLTKWADKAMFESEPMKDIQPRVYLLSATPDPLGAIAAACMMYEGKVCRDMADITDDQRRHYWEQVQKTHLKAPLEFVDLHFMVEGVTRSFTHQMVRQRTAVYAQESLRFAVKENMSGEMRVPPSLDKAAPGTLSQSDREIGREVWTVALDHLQEAYDTLVAMGVPQEDARGLLPHDVLTRLNYKTNLRNLLDHAGNRLCTQAQFEWRVVFNELLGAISNHGQQDIYHFTHTNGSKVGGSVRWQWRHIADSNVFKPVCFEVGHCPFTASFDRECKIRDRVQAGKFEEISPAEWMLDPTAARESA